jgi:hypothetical protein
VISTLLLALLFAQDPTIGEVRTITGGFARSGCWLPLKVRVTGAGGTPARLVATADAGFRVVRSFQFPPSGTADLLLPVVVLSENAKVEVALQAGGREVAQRLAGRVTFLNRERLVLIDPRHPDFDSLLAQDVRLPGDQTPVRFASSDPADWNEAADMGAMEIVDAVIATEDRQSELTMTAWRALSGGILTQPRRDLFDRLEEPAARFPSIDPMVGRLTVDESWIPKKRDATLVFIVIYGFAFFVAVFVTWSRKGGAWLVLASALGISGIFLAAYSALYPKGHLAIRTWQGVVDGPEPVSISLSALWGTGRAGDLEMGRIVKPVHASAGDAAGRDLEMERTPEGLWIVRGARPGDPTRFVSVERMNSRFAFTRFGIYRPEESQYYLRVPRKTMISLQNPKSATPVPVRGRGIVDSEVVRCFGIEVRK